MKKIFLLFVIVCFMFSSVFADTNGIWHNAQDIKPGIIGKDEGAMIGNNFTFLNDVYMQSFLKIKGNLQADNNLAVKENTQINGNLNVLGLTILQSLNTQSISSQTIDVTNTLSINNKPVATKEYVDSKTRSSVNNDQIICNWNGWFDDYYCNIMPERIEKYRRLIQNVPYNFASAQAPVYTPIYDEYEGGSISCVGLGASLAEPQSARFVCSSGFISKIVKDGWLANTGSTSHPKGYKCSITTHTDGSYDLTCTASHEHYCHSSAWVGTMVNQVTDFYWDNSAIFCSKTTFTKVEYDIDTGKWKLTTQAARANHGPAVSVETDTVGGYDSTKIN